ncbi:MAG: hypothetical protein COA36_13015 [Desulfotalea sp.]|nr:MAG: hypothetical protein COA36_13015 [Desulfotalea sp.]
MKLTSLTVFVLVYLASLTSGVASTWRSSPPVSMDEQQVTTIRFMVARGYTIVDGQKRTLFIDYDKGVVVNLAKETGRCRQFSLLSSEQDAGFVTGQIKLFSELIFLEEGQPKGEDGQYSRYKVINAPRAMLLRGVTKATFAQYGVTFTPGVTTYNVDLEHVDFKELLALTEHNGSIGSGITPLIFQLDITHFLSRFGGVPVVKIEKARVVELYFAIYNAQSLRGMLAAQCVDL